MYADEHPPAHFHVDFSDGMRCSVEINSLAIIAGSVRPLRRLHEPLEWAAENRAVLHRKWRELTK